MAAFEIELLADVQAMLLYRARANIALDVWRTPFSE
jgi:hypothetical protein